MSSVASDITCVSGRLMLQALIDGQRDPAMLAELAKRRLRAKIPELTEALTGRFTPSSAATTTPSWPACIWTPSINAADKSLT